MSWHGATQPSRLRNQDPAASALAGNIAEYASKNIAYAPNGAVRIGGRGPHRLGALLRGLAREEGPGQRW